MLSPGNYQILIFKAENPKLDFEWEVTSFPEEIDKFEYLSNKPVTESKVPFDFNKSLRKYHFEPSTKKTDKDKSMSPRKDKSKVSVE